MHVAPRYTLPPIVSTLDPGSVKGLTQIANPKASTGATTGTTSTTSSDGDLGTTFLNLLATELQNQDPTDPVDSTAMVGQMISLNQLDQLVSINQALTSSSSTATSGSAQPAAAASAAAKAAIASPSPASAPANQLPFNPDTMMPVNPALYPAPFNSSTTNNTSGGK
jgi:flagellar basal-body rod modification protein FlgD